MGRRLLIFEQTDLINTMLMLNTTFNFRPHRHIKLFLLQAGFSCLQSYIKISEIFVLDSLF